MAHIQLIEERAPPIGRDDRAAMSSSSSSSFVVSAPRTSYVYPEKEKEVDAALGGVAGVLGARLDVRADRLRGARPPDRRHA